MPRMNSKAAAAVGALLVAAGGAVPLIASYEGYEPIGYPDPALGAALPTACFGHTRTAKIGVYYSQEQCMALLADDVITHAIAIMPCVKAEVPSKTLAAFISLSYNIGSANFCNSTLVRKMNAGDLPGACAEISRWDKANGKVMAGLTRRRQEERAWCEAGLKEG